MIIFEKHGDILDSSLDALVCPVNTVGTMGKALALSFKQRWPHLDHEYKKACRLGAFVRQGYHVDWLEGNRKVVFMPTKQHWANPSKLEWIDRSLIAIAEGYEEHGIQSLAIPAVGCGEGGLPWLRVRGLIHQHFGPNHPLPVGVYCPQ